MRWGLRGGEGTWGGCPRREGGPHWPLREHSSAKALGDRDLRYQEAGRSPCGPHALTIGGGGGICRLRRCDELLCARGLRPQRDSTSEPLTGMYPCQRLENSMWDSGLLVGATGLPQCRQGWDCPLQSCALLCCFGYHNNRPAGLWGGLGTLTWTQPGPCLPPSWGAWQWRQHLPVGQPFSSPKVALAFPTRCPLRVGSRSYTP